MIILYTFCLLLLVSCNETSSNRDSRITIHLSQNLEDNTLHESYSISKFIDSVDYILLESTKECLIDVITEIYFAEDRIFVMDYAQGGGRLLAFDYSGKYMHQISSRGRSGQEYYRIKSAMFDDDNKQIMLHCNPSKKILYYDYDGNFIKKLDLGKTSIIREITNLSDGGFMCYTPDVEVTEDGPSTGLWRIDSMGNYVRNYIDVNKWDSEYAFVHIEFPSQFHRFPNGDLVLADGFQSDLYYYDAVEDSVINYVDYIIADFNLDRCTKSLISEGSTERYIKSTTTQIKGDYIYNQWMNPSLSSIYHIPTSSFICVKGVGFDYDLPVARFMMVSNNLSNALIMAPTGVVVKNYLDDVSISTELKTKIREQFGAMTDQQIAESNPLIQIMYVKE